MKTHFSKILSFITCCSLMLSACSDNTDVLSESESTPVYQNEYHVSIDDALEFADSIIMVLDGNSTRSIEREVKSIEFISNGHLTKSLASDSDLSTLYYLVNYEDNKGFALLGADKRAERIYAFSNQGSFNLQDTVFNEGLRLFVEDLPTNFTDSLKVKPEIPYNPSVVNIRKRIECQPFLTTTVSNWGQSYPYNRYCPYQNESTSIRGYVGCAAVAVGMAMSAFQKPTSINGYTINWQSVLNDKNSESTARIFQILGTPDFLNMNYTKTGSSATYSKVKSTLTKLGYLYSSGNQFFVSNIQSSLSSKWPILVLGTRIVDEKKGLKSGHAWIIDGLYSITTTIMPGSINPSVNTAYYTHNVWGWNGQSNGYFLFNDGLGGTPDILGKDDAGGTGYRYTSDFQFLYQLRIF